MTTTHDYLKKYYGRGGNYLDDHEDFLNSANIKEDIHFLIEVLELDKKSIILDLACGQGRHTVALVQKGYHVDGVDFSRYLLDKAIKTVEEINLDYKPLFFESDITDLYLEKKYNRAYWFFSDLASIDIEKVIKSLNKCLQKKAIAIFDVDNVFRIINYILNNPNSGFIFDAEKMELIDNENDIRIPYPAFPMWKHWFEKNGFFIEEIFGDYDLSSYSVNSKRLIMKIKKTT